MWSNDREIKKTKQNKQTRKTAGTAEKKTAANKFRLRHPR